MHWIVRSVLLVLSLTSLSRVVCAQSNSVSDLALTATIVPGTRLLPGSKGRITFAIHNNGPDAALVTGVVSSSYLFGPGQQFYLFDVAETAPCRLDFDDFAPMPGQPVILVALLFDDGPVPSGTTVTCTVGIGAWPDATGTTELRCRAGHGSLGLTDPRPGNDTVNFLLSFDPESIPTLGLGGMTMLVALALWLAIRHLGEAGQYVSS
jgi:hypothetical protein